MRRSRQHSVAVCRTSLARDDGLRGVGKALVLLDSLRRFLMSQDNRNRDQQNDKNTKRDQSARQTRGSSMEPKPTDENRSATRQDTGANVDDTAEMDDEDRDDDERSESGPNRRRNIS